MWVQPWGCEYSPGGGATAPGVSAQPWGWGYSSGGGGTAPGVGLQPWGWGYSSGGGSTNLSDHGAGVVDDGDECHRDAVDDVTRVVVALRAVARERAESVHGRSSHLKPGTGSGYGVRTHLGYRVRTHLGYGVRAHLGYGASTHLGYGVREQLVELLMGAVPHSTPPRRIKRRPHLQHAPREASGDHDTTPAPHSVTARHISEGSAPCPYCLVPCPN